jgi:predicted HicB family RNase H-like nuclease
VGRVNIEIEEELHKKMKIACAMKGTTIIEFINEAIAEKLKEKKNA